LKLVFLEALLAETPNDSHALARFCARFLDKQKFEAIKVFDVRDSIQITDCFVIASGKNPRHLKAAAEELVRELRAKGIARRGREGYQEGKWILIDLFAVVVHLFLGETRRYYDLELLWGDGPLVPWEEKHGLREEQLVGEGS
jgi:ribosome-associated protein